MSAPSAGITFTTMQEMLPKYNLPPDLLEDVVAALPPPPDDAAEAWRHARLDRAVEEIASRVPMNAAQAALAGQVVIAQRLADAMATRAGAPGLPTLELVRLGRLTDALLHTVTRLERTLERRQFRVMPFRDVRPVDGADLAAMDRAWGRRATGAVGEAVRGRSAAAAPWPEVAGGGKAELVVVDGVWCDRATGEPATGWRGPDAAAAGRTKAGVDAGAKPRHDEGAARHDVVGQGAGTVSERPRSRDGVTVEQGDGYTLEIWPAVAAADAGPGGPGLVEAGSRRGPGDRA
jgi:hypothetical protein